MSYPNYFTDNGVGITNIAGDTKIGVGINGLEVEYDIGTPSERKFRITPAGIDFATNNVVSYTTGLERLCAVQQAFQAVELPPNSTTLEINKQLNLDDQLGNVASLGLVGSDLVISSTAGVVKINDTLDMSGNDILNVNSITATADLLLNPTGSIDANGKTLNMTAGEIHNCPLIHSQNNNDITIEGKGTGDLILKTGNTNRLAISDTGDWTINGGVGTSGQVLTSGGAGVSPSWTTLSAGGATIDITNTDTNATYYPTFVDSAGTGRTLRADTTTTPWTINPNTRSFNFADTIIAGVGAGSTNSVLGKNAGTNNTGCVAVGDSSRGANNGGSNSTCVGRNSGYNGAGDRSTLIGGYAGQVSTGVNTICLGYYAGGSFSVPANNIIIDAKNGVNITSSAGTDRLFIDPIRNATQTTALGYDTTTKEITYYTPNSTLIQTEDMLYYPELILNAPYPSLAGIMGTEIPLAVYNFNGATTETWNGGYNANLLSGSLQRLGCSLLYSGGAGYTQHTSINEYSFTQISKITWGFCCLGNNTPDGLPTLTTDATYVMGLAPTADRASSLFALNTNNSIFWCWNGASYSPPTTTKFSFIINGVSQYTLTTNTNMTGKWGRCGFTINYVSGNTAQVQGFFTDLSTGITETTGVYTITGGTGFVNPITSPNACSVYHSIYGTTPRWFLVDYIQVETPNLYQIGVGSTQTTGR